MRALVFLSLLPVFLVTPVSCAVSTETGRDTAGARSVVLVLVDELAWEEVRETPSLEEAFSEGAVANLSTAQGAEPEDPRMNYALLGAGSRTNTSLLPENLPQKAPELAEAFEGPAASIQPGALGEALSEAGVTVAAVGERARLAVMDLEGRVPRSYKSSEPTASSRAALEAGAEFVAVEAGSPEEAGRIATAAQGAGAVVAVASPNVPAGSANLTPFVVNTPRQGGLLYSPTTRTKGLISSVDVAPTLLGQLGIEVPPEMQGRAAGIRPGAAETAIRLDERLSFVAEERFLVWLLVGAAMAVGASLAILWKRKAGAVYALLVLAALPGGALVAAAAPISNAFAVALLTLFLGAALAGMIWRNVGSGAVRISGVYLAVSALILADTPTGGTLMKFSTLGYDPAQGTRFNGIGNEYP
ncbi:MAG: hypothetical protein ACFB50_02120, partial [Rubrobacteraceae bacterium]